MIELAQNNIETGFSNANLSWLEDYMPPEDTFDLVISSLALHYISDLSLILKKVHKSLKPGGRFIFSVEHPVITSSNSALKGSAVRQAWIVDDYFKRGERLVEWMGDSVTKYHRTIEDFLNELTSAGFNLQKLRESEPPRKCFNDEALWVRRSRIPLFLIIEGLKK